MELNEYQTEAHKTRVYKDYDVTYPLIGLVGEVGEFANIYKKVLRGDHHYVEVDHKLLDELGDVLWYVAALATDMGYSLDFIAKNNIGKLAARQKEGTIQGHNREENKSEPVEKNGDEIKA